MILTPIPASEATSVDVLFSEQHEALPENTITGPVCGSCSQHARRFEDDRRVQVRHATVEHVRYCFGVNYDMEAEARAEVLIERRTEMFFEGAFRPQTAEDLEEDARERWAMSLQGL